MIGKAGRADTPTDPAPLDMVETFVNFRPKELWPKRVLKYPRAEQQVSIILNFLQKEGYLKGPPDKDELTRLDKSSAPLCCSNMRTTVETSSMRGPKSLSNGSTK